MPTAVPPRTSSTQHGSGAPSSSRRATYANERGTNSPRRAQPETNGSLEDDAAAAQSSRSHRAVHHHQIAQEPPQRSSSTRAGDSTTSIPIRSQQAASASTSSKGPSREASEILNSILISQPEVDIDREKERLALAQPHHAQGGDDQVASPPVPSPMDNGEETRRGGRSRHDYSSKREKHTKFGEYILGNTIGEGEFGKVKLGWKPEGGVQVRFMPPESCIYISISSCPLVAD